MHQDNAPETPDLNLILQEFDRLQHDIDSRTSAFSEMSTRLFGDDVVDLNPDWPERAIKLVRRVTSALISRAEREFGSANAPLRIDRDALLHEYPAIEDFRNQSREFYSAHDRYPAFRETSVDFNALWASLVHRYGNGRGIAAAIGQRAEFLATAFGLGKASTVRRSSAGVTLAINVPSVKSPLSCYAGKYCANHFSGDPVRGVFAALATFADWAGLSELAAELQGASVTMSARDYLFRPRDRIKLDGIDVVLLTSEWRFVFSFAVAEQLNAFLSTFHAPFSTSDARAADNTPIAIDR